MNKYNFLNIFYLSKKKKKKKKKKRKKKVLFIKEILNFMFYYNIKNK